MNYLKTAEVAFYCPRSGAPTGDELSYSNIASRLIDTHCNRTLSIKYYLIDFEMSANLAGHIPMRPIVAFSPVTLTTGLAVRPLGKNWNGGRRLLGNWVDIDIPTDIESLVNQRTGRIEIYSSLITDYGRAVYVQAPRSAYAWLAKMELYAGFLLDTTLSVAAINGATSATLQSVIGLAANLSKINFGDSATDYLVTSIVGNLITFTPALVVTSTLPIGYAVTGSVPEDVKVACGQIVEDRLTYEPNTLRQAETLDVISERFTRMDVSPIPVDAQRILSKYRN